MVSVRKETDKSITHEGPKVERVPLSSSERKRHSKHYDLKKQVLKKLADLPDKSALKLPLALGRFFRKRICARQCLALPPQKELRSPARRIARISMSGNVVDRVERRKKPGTDGCSPKHPKLTVLSTNESLSTRQRVNFESFQ